MLAVSAMRLRLKVISIQRKVMGSSSSVVLGPKGGTLGRSRGNDWVLPDPERYVSGKHATIDFKDDQFLLTDTSTNGVYLNDAEEPVGRGVAQALCHGDLLRIGAFSIAVAVEESSASGKAVANSVPAPVADTKFSSEESGVFQPDMTHPHGLGEKSELDRALLPDETGIERSLAMDIPKAAEARQPTSELEVELLPSDELREETWLELEPEPKAEASSLNADTEVEVEEMPAALRRLEEQASVGGLSGSNEQSAQSGPVGLNKQTPDATASGALAHLLKGAGISPDSLGGVNNAEVLQNIGCMLRETVLGLMDVMQNRAEMKNSFRLQQTMIRPVDNNPFKFSAGVDEALTALLSRSGSKFLPPVDALREAFEDIKDHQLAHQLAMREAFNEFIGRFDPDDLRERFDRGLKRGALMGATNKMKYWDLYRELYEVMTQHSDQAFPRLFAEVFAQAYEESKEKLKQAREKKLRKEIRGTARS